MLQAAVLDQPGMIVDDRELRRAGPSYMVDTLASLRQELGDTPLALILGLDAFCQLDSWHRWLQLIELAHIVVMTRPGWTTENITSTALIQMLHGHKTEDLEECHHAPAGKLVFCPVTPVDISSTAIRAAHGEGEDIRQLVPLGVYRIIEKEHIYT